VPGAGEHGWRSIASGALQWSGSWNQRLPEKAQEKIHFKKLFQEWLTDK
jgi:hypothetical protein